jgi:hypothetical protein
MKSLFRGVYLWLLIVGMVFAIMGSYLQGRSTHSAEAQARRPDERFISGPTVSEVVLALDGRLDLAVDYEEE